MRSRQWCQSSRCSLLLLSHVWSSGPRSLSKVYVQLHTVTTCPRVKNPTQPAPQHDEERSTRLTPTRSRHQRPGRHTLHPRQPIRFKLLQSLHTPMIIILTSSGSQRDGLDLRLQNRFCLYNHHKLFYRPKVCCPKYELQLNFFRKFSFLIWFFLSQNQFQSKSDAS